MLNKKCKNCPLFNNKDNTCSVAIFYEGEYYVLKVKAEDDCHWANKYDLVNEIKQINLENK